ncbi:hypothetical protein TELCIR_21308, partial [Teladorsagia circumcincta]
IVAFLGATDSYLLSHAYFTTLLKGASAQIVFGFDLFPIVSAEDLATMDATCIICRDEMTPESTPKRLP